jgi:hypothetical protein
LANRDAIVFYISGHGFGHASRQIEIINAVFAQRPEARVVVRTSAPRWLFERTLRGPADVQSVAADTGAVQRGALEIDVTATVREAAAFHASPQVDARIDDEARALDEAGAQLVVGDVPPLAFAAAARAGVRSVAISNFTWDWIYGGYEEAETEAPGLVERLRAWYALADEAWRLPMCGGFEGMRVTADLPLVARHARHEPAAVRARLGLPPDEPLVLVSFGGYGARELDVVRAAASLTAARIVLTTASPNGHPPGTSVIQEDALYGAGLRYEDLVSAVDIVLTKPGYGIVSECIANRTRLLYTSRGRVREYEVFLDEMPRALPCAFIPREDLATGNWQDSIARLLAQPDVRPQATNGAEVAAARLLSLVPTPALDR